MFKKMCFVSLNNGNNTAPVVTKMKNKRYNSKKKKRLKKKYDRVKCYYK